MKTHQPVPKPHSPYPTRHSPERNTALQKAAAGSASSQQLAQLQMMANSSAPTQRLQRMAPPKQNSTGLPDALKSGIENLSGMSMDHVRVHRNSAKPAQLQAHAYAQGSDIHLGPGQERHLPHEAWHVVQQAQGRVKPTMQMKGIGVNDDAGLEQEADVMGAKAAQLSPITPIEHLHQGGLSTGVTAIQRRKLVKNKLNMVGENHVISGARRPDEKKFAASKGFVESQYLLEHQFEYSVRQRNLKDNGDPIVLRLEYLMDSLHNQLSGLNDKFDVATYLAQYKQKKGEVYELWRSFRYMFLQARYADTLKVTSLNYVEELKNDGVPYADWAHLAARVGTVTDGINAIVNKNPVAQLIERTFTPHHQAFEPVFQRYRVLLGREPSVKDAMYQRSEAMHHAATYARGEKVVWKVGDDHIKQIKDDIHTSGSFTYNIMTMQEFDAALAEYKKGFMGKGTSLIYGLGHAAMERRKKKKIVLPDTLAPTRGNNALAWPGDDNEPQQGNHKDLLRYSIEKPGGGLLDFGGE